MSELRSKWRASNLFERVMVVLIAIGLTVVMVIKVGLIVAVLMGADVPK